MWALHVTRRDLVDLITPRRVDDVLGAVEAPHPPLERLGPSGMLAVWPGSPSLYGRLPTAIIVPEGASRDALAWFATYARDLRPFSAFCRVIEKPTAEKFFGGPSVPYLIGAEGICTGLILGEALMRSRGDESTFELPVSTHRETLSYAIARTFALTKGSVPNESVTRLWSHAHSVHSQNDLPTYTSEIVSAWNLALRPLSKPQSSPSLLDPANEIAPALSDLHNSGEIRETIWGHLLEDLPELKSLRDLGKFPREQRVQMVDVALRVLATSRKNADIRVPFLAGYLASLVAPGSLAHAGILAPLGSLFPTAYLWYGLCAGFSARGDVLSIGGPLARRIVRDLTSPDHVVDRPRCDIALEELAMHGIVATQVTDSVDRLDVDILPGVTSPVRLPSLSNITQDHLQRSRKEEIQRLAAQLNETAARSQYLVSQLVRVSGVDEDDYIRSPKQGRRGRSKTPL